MWAKWPGEFLSAKHAFFWSVDYIMTSTEAYPAALVVIPRGLKGIPYLRYALEIMRVLALHGYTQNAHILGKKMGAIRRECVGDVEFVFVDAPHVVQPVDLPFSTRTCDYDRDDVNTFTQSPVTDDPTSTPREWGKANEDKTIYTGVDHSIRMLRGVLETQGPFNGVLGFSQGAGMAALLSAYLEDPSLEPIMEPPPHRPFDFCILVSGAAPVYPKLPSGIRTPSLHVIGRTDIIVSGSQSQTLIDAFVNARVEIHAGGHFVPSKAIWRQFFRSYILSFAPGSLVRPEDVSSPVPSPSPVLVCAAESWSWSAVQIEWAAYLKNRALEA